MRPMLLLALFATLLVLPLNGCGRPSATQNQPNVILISIDTLRADRLHGYGYERETSPVLDDLMRQGTSFLTTISQSPWTLPSHMSMFTGLYPHAHGVTEDTLALNEEVPTLPMLLKKMGYQTGGFSSCEYLSAKYGFGRGFDTYLQRRGIDAPVVCEEALKWLIQEKPRKYFLFLHFYDVHPSYNPSENYLKVFESSYSGNIRGSIQSFLDISEGTVRVNADDIRHLNALYDAEIRQLDHQLGVLFEFLREKGLLTNTILMVTSDHGEEFFDHGGVLHSRTLYDELIKVPLIIAGTGIPAGKTISDQAQLVDVAPTILELCGDRLQNGMSGRSLVPLLSGKPNGTTYAYSEADKDNSAPNIKRAIRSERYKLYYDVQSKAEELYDVIHDPKEQNNIAVTNSEPAILLRAELRKWMATETGYPLSVSLTEEEKNQLRSLGYFR